MGRRSAMLGRIYLDLGDRLTGDREPPEPVTVLTAHTVRSARPPVPVWPWLHWLRAPGAAGPLNVAVRRARGDTAVVSTRRGRYWRLRIPREPVDLNAVYHAYGGCVHHGCDWPGCPALMDIIANMDGGPGAVSGWHTYKSWRMCDRHSAVWLDGTHKPAWDYEQDPDRPPMVCSCGTPLPGPTLGHITTVYQQHLTDLEEAHDG